MNCPHCSKDIPNAVDQETLRQRLAAKDGELDAKTRELNDVRSKANGYETMKTQFEQAQAQAQKIAAEHAQYRDLVARGYTDPRVGASIAAIHAAEMAGKEGKDRVELGAWLDGDGKAHPVISQLRPAQPANPAAAPANPANPAAPAQPANPAAAPAANPANPANPAAPPNPPPSPNAGAGNPGAPARMTPAQLQSYFASAEYKSLSREDRAKKVQELSGTYKGQPTNPTPVT